MKSIYSFFVVILFFLMTGFGPKETKIPYWLEDYKTVYEQNPAEANREWFKNAKFGMFVHLNLASLCENGKDDYKLWAKGEAPDRLLKFVGVDRKAYQSAENKDALLYQKYTLENFDAEKICQLAKKAKMKYITFTTHHLGGCYNFKTSLSDFNSLNAPCKSDLAAEMAKACKKYGIALFMYVPPQISLTTKEAFEHNKTYLTELLTQYGDVAGIWFDGIGGFYRNPENYNRLTEIHQLVKELQPHALVSFKEGAICDEDFLSPEHFMLPFEYNWENKDIQKRFDIRVERWKGFNTKMWPRCNKYKLREINTVMQKCKGRDNTHADGGWINDESTEHYSAEEVYKWLKYSRFTGSNMLMNIGPRGDGSIHPDDEKALTEVGKMIKKIGWPKLKNEIEK